MVKIYECLTKAKADAIQAEVFAQELASAPASGNTVLNNEIISKNAATGMDEPSAQRTTASATVVQSPDKTWYMTQYKTFVPSGIRGVDFAIRDKPQSFVDGLAGEFASSFGDGFKKT